MGAWNDKIKLSLDVPLLKKKKIPREKVDSSSIAEYKDLLFINIQNYG